MHICFLLPYDMIARNFTESHILHKLLESKDISRITLVSRVKPDITNDKLHWIKGISPFKYNQERPFNIRLLFSDLLFTIGYFLHLVLINRFNTLAGFKGFQNRTKQSKRLHYISAKEGLPTSKLWGFPFRESSVLYHFLSKIYHDKWQLHWEVNQLFLDNKTDLLVVGHLQNHFIAPYVLAAQRNGIEILGINGSWDQPTTKGALFPFEGNILVQNKKVKEELIQFHDISDERVHICGWPQMDIYADPSIFKDRDNFLKSINLKTNCKYVLIGAYSERLGYHEPAMCEALAKALLSNDNYQDVIIYIRSHPLDNEWEKRMGYLRQYPNIRLEAPSSGNLPHLANLIKHSSVVISSAGTISLDAVALNRPAIAIAFEDDALPYYDRPARRYDMEHYAAVMQSGGVKKVVSQEELHDAVIAYIDNPQLDAQNRANLRRSHLEPLDGNASSRIVNFILDKALK